MIDGPVLVAALTLSRVATFIYFLPLLGGTNTPQTVKIGLSVALAAVFFGDASAALAGAGGRAYPGTVSWLLLFLALAREMLLGAVLGVAFNLLLVPARVAGEFIAQESGLTFANVVSATGDGSANTLATLFEMIASAIFLALDLHHVFLQVLRETFRMYPVGSAFLFPDWDLIRATSAAQEGGLMLAAPVAFCLVLTTLVLVLLTRTAPHLNLFSFGFPTRVLVSLAVMVLLLPQFLAGLVAQFSWLIDLLKWRA